MKKMLSVLLVLCCMFSLFSMTGCAAENVTAEENNSLILQVGNWTIVKKVDRGMRKISKAQPRHAGRTKVQPD